MSVAGGPDGLNDVYEALDSYSWDDDVEFQSGLSAILGSNSTPEQAAELTLRARCFYFARYILYIYRFSKPLTNMLQKVQHKHRLRCLQSLPRLPGPASACSKWHTSASPHQNSRHKQRNCRWHYARRLCESERTPRSIPYLFRTHRRISDNRAANTRD